MQIEALHVLPPPVPATSSFFELLRFMCRLALNASQSCSSPFGQTANCYPAEAGLPKVIDDDAYCAADFARMYNVSAQHSDILQNLTAISTDLHDECESIHVKVRLPHPRSGISVPADYYVLQIPFVLHNCLLLQAVVASKHLPISLLSAIYFVWYAADCCG
jgi:hypothetical protein